MDKNVHRPHLLEDEDMKEYTTKDEQRRVREEEADDLAFRRAVEKKKNAGRTVREDSGAVFAAPKEAGRRISPSTLQTENKTVQASLEAILGAIASRRARKSSASKEKKAFRVFLSVVGLMLGMLIIGYTVFVFAPIPFVRKWRDLYIGTAMTTGDHQWLATYFIPSGIIEDVMSNNTIDTDVIGGLEHLTKPVTEAETDDVTVPADTGTPPVEDPYKDDILGLKLMTVGGKDYAGNEVTVIDEEEGLFISKIDGGTYKGLVMLIDDPSRVFVGTTPAKTTRGYRIGEMMDYYGGVIAGINGSGFSDPNDSGTGNDIIGYCMSQGESWGRYAGYMASLVFTENDRLVVGVINDWESYGIRDGLQFGPVLVANGKINITAGAAASFGLQPRTAIGQREDGVIVMLVIDGRDITHSLGCTIEDMANIMMQYEAVNAGCCDGGSSCVLAYEGVVLNKNSSANPTYGRRIPNAFLVKSKKAQSAETEN